MTRLDYNGLILDRYQIEMHKNQTNRRDRITFPHRESMPNTEEAKAPTIYVVAVETIDLDKGYYHGVYVLLQYKKDDGVGIKE